MYRRRRLRKRRYTRRPRRLLRRRYRRSFKRRINSPRSGIHFFKRTKNLTPININFGTSTWISDGWSFKLADLPDYTEFTTLFKYYKINRIKLRFTMNQPYVITKGEMPSSTFEVPEWWSFVDYNDANPTSNLDSVLEMERYKHLQIRCKKWKAYFKPRIANLSFDSVAVLGFNYTMGSSWISTNNINIQHYGYKWGISRTGNGDNGSFGTILVRATYYMSFKSTK